MACYRLFKYALKPLLDKDSSANSNSQKKLEDRIDTHEVAGSIPAPPTSLTHLGPLNGEFWSAETREAPYKPANTASQGHSACPLSPPVVDSPWLSWWFFLPSQEIESPP